MKMEKISETQIKCTLTSLDLSMRNMNLGELAYGSEKAKNLFTEMMQKASSEFGFDAEGAPLMIEAIPMNDNGIVLMITKVDDPEEIDTRFARFAPYQEDPADAAQSIFESLFQAAQSQLQTPADGSKRAFVFSDLDSVTEAAGALGGKYAGDNSLYKNPDTGEYYLVLEEEGPDSAVFISTCSILGEYARPAVFNYSGSGYLKEHYELIISKTAISKMALI